MDESTPDYTKVMSYVERNPAGVLGTVGDDGPHGAVVYSITASHGLLCFTTKTGTQKYQDILKRPQISLTIFNEREGTTLQLMGKAFVAENQQLKDMVLDKMTKAHAIRADWVPPIVKLQAGDFVVMGIEIAKAKLTDYGGVDMSPPVVTEVT